MASVEVVADSVQERLERLGKLKDIRASLRHEVFQCLQSSRKAEQHCSPSRCSNTVPSDGGGDDQAVSSNVNNNAYEEPKIIMPMEVKLCHLLIQEYLQSSGLHHTLNTFNAETSDMDVNISSSNKMRFNTKDISNTIQQELFEFGDDRNGDEQLEKVFKMNNRDQLQVEENIPTLFTIVSSMRKWQRKT